MRKMITLVAAALALGVVVPHAVQAQGRVTREDVIRNKGRKNDDRNRDVRRVRDRRNDRRDDDYNDRDRYDDRYGQNGKGKGNGPAFCRSGAGHPVFGRQWCVSKGFGLGRDNSYGRWDRVTWDDVIFRRRPRTNYELGRDVLIDVLGGSVFNRLDAQRRYFGINSPLSGHWNSYEGESVLLLNAGGFPIAELVDRNGDRRVDYILLNRR